jgi:hypothetical protein
MGRIQGCKSRRASEIERQNKLIEAARLEKQDMRRSATVGA